MIYVIFVLSSPQPKCELIIIVTIITIIIMIIIVKYNCNDNNTTTTNKDNYIGYSNGSKDKTLFRK